MPIATLFTVMGVMLVIGVPIGISICAGLLSVALLYGTTTLAFIGQQLYSGLDSFPLMAVPCFMLAGSLMEVGGISKRLVRVAEVFLGHQVGGYCAVTVVACLFFGAISGSAPATVAAIGGIMIPYMVDAGYEKSFATGLSAVAGSLGIIIPPSIPFVVYGVSTNTSIADLFLSGFVPGIIIGVALIAVAKYLCKKKGYKGSERRFTTKEKLEAIKDAIPAIIMPVIILGGIYGGICTPTEAATVAIYYSIFVGFFIYKEMRVQNILDILNNTASFVGAVMLAFAPAAAMGGVLSMLGVPALVRTMLTSVSDDLNVIMLIVLVVLLIAGMILDTMSSIVILAPIFYSALIPIGVDPIYLGCVMICALAIGFITPPVAQNLFVASTMTGVPMHKVVKSAMPFIIAMLLCVLLIIFVPPLTTFLPNLLKG